MTKVDHLAMAKEDLAIAESGDAKREAYKRAADHMAAAKAEDPKLTSTVLARTVGTSEGTVRKLLRWRESGFQAETPFLVDERATERAALSHAKKIIREEPKKIAAAITEADPEQRKEIIEALASSDETRDEVLSSSVKHMDEQSSKHPTPRRTERQGAVDAHGRIGAAALYAAAKGREALEYAQTVDEPIPADLRDDALRHIDTAVTAWQLVAANLRGESVGDEAEAFLAAHDE